MECPRKRLEEMIKHLNKISDKIIDLPAPVKTSVVYMLCSVLQKGVAFIAVPIYTRMVPSDQYGVYSLYQSWESILIIFATLNMWNYLFNNGMIKFENRKDEFTSSLIGLSSVLTTVLFIIYAIINEWFNKINGLPIAVIFMMFVDFYLRPSYEYWCSRQRFEYNVKKYAVSAVTVSVCTPLLSIGLIYTFSKLENSLGTMLVAGKVICSGVVYFIIMLSLLKKSKKMFDKEIWIFALKFNVPLIPHFLSIVILAQSDRIMIGNICGKSEAAIYSVAYSIGAIMLIVNSALMDSIIPWIYKNLRKKNYAQFPLVSTVALLVIALINILVSLCAPEIIAIMAPEEYQNAIYIVPPVAISNVFIFMFNLYANIEYFYEETKLVAVASCFSAIMNIILNYIFINEFGFIAAGYTTVVCYLLYALCHYLFMKYILRKYNITGIVYNNRLLWTMAIGALVIAIVVVLIYPHPLIRWGIIIVAIIFAFLFRKKIVGFFLDIRKSGRSQEERNE